MNKNNEIGKIGEDKACEYLKNKEYRILNRNYRQKFGEIDIIARAPDLRLIFIEVKTLLIKSGFKDRGLIPEDNITTQKYNRVKKICEFFANKYPKLINEKVGWQIDLIAIQIIEMTENQKFSIRHYENI
jgi:putative endonuclease